MIEHHPDLYHRVNDLVTLHIDAGVDLDGFRKRRPLVWRRRMWCITNPDRFTVLQTKNAIWRP